MRRNRCSSHLSNGKCIALMASSCSDISNDEDGGIGAFLLGKHVDR